MSEQLASIGFQIDEYGRGIPGIVATHPEVKRLRIEVDTLQGSTPWLSAMQTNAAAIDETRLKLGEFKSASTHLLV